MRRVEVAHGTYAYIVTPQAARTLLRECFPLTYQLDTEIVRAIHRRPTGLVPIATVPPLVDHDASYESEVQTS